MITRVIAAALVATAVGNAGAQTGGASSATAERYPNRPIRLIVPTGAGGSTDLVARTIAQRLSETLGQQMVADNRGGSGGIIGTELVARAAPDGYTLLIGVVGNLAISPHLYRKLPYDAIKDFAPVAQISSSAYVWLVSASLPVNSVKEFVALARAQPGQLRYSSSGSGTGGHLAQELFFAAAKINVTHVPYKSGAATITSILSDEVHMTFIGIPSGLPHVKSGRVRPLAVTAGSRASVMPDVPTFAELGYTGAEATSWTGLVAPAGTPSAVVARLNAEVNQALQSPEVRTRLSGAGAEPVGSSSPEQFAAHIKAELAKWGKVVRATGAKAD